MGRKNKYTYQNKLYKELKLMTKEKFESIVKRYGTVEETVRKGKPICEVRTGHRKEIIEIDEDVKAFVKSSSK